MDEIITRGLNAKRESKYIEFKSSFDPKSGRDWCEIIKDIVAISNTGDGVIVFGLHSNGTTSNYSIESIKSIDPALITDKIYKYTGHHFSEFQIVECEKGGSDLVALRIYPTEVPIIFENPGTYDIGDGKQKTAFSKGTIYFRHGAKSEPGSRDDIRKFVEKRLDKIRREWLKRVRTVVQAPPGTSFAVLPDRTDKSKGILEYAKETEVRIVSDPNAPAVRICENKDEADSRLVHEELSTGLFERINNVIQANTIISQGRKKFLFGEEVYYRIYSERKYVNTSNDELVTLALSGLGEFYAPSLYWLLKLPSRKSGLLLRSLFDNPKHPHVLQVLRIIILLGNGAYKWALQALSKKWEKITQPPSYYFTFKKLCSKIDAGKDIRLIVLKTTSNRQIDIESQGRRFTIEELLNSKDDSERLLSVACMSVFDGNKSIKGTCRDLDILTYARDLSKKSKQISKVLVHGSS